MTTHIGAVLMLSYPGGPEHRQSRWPHASQAFLMNYRPPLQASVASRVASGLKRSHT